MYSFLQRFWASSVRGHRVCQDLLSSSTSEFAPAAAKSLHRRGISTRPAHFGRRNETRMSARCVLFSPKDLKYRQVAFAVNAEGESDWRLLTDHLSWSMHGRCNSCVDRFKTKYFPLRRETSDGVVASGFRNRYETPFAGWIRRHLRRAT